MHNYVYLCVSVCLSVCLSLSDYLSLDICTTYSLRKWVRKIQRERHTKTDRLGVDNYKKKRLSSLCCTQPRTSTLPHLFYPAVLLYICKLPPTSYIYTQTHTSIIATSVGTTSFSNLLVLHIYSIRFWTFLYMHSRKSIYLYIYLSTYVVPDAIQHMCVFYRIYLSFFQRNLIIHLLMYSIPPGKTKYSKKTYEQIDYIHVYHKCSQNVIVLI